MKVWVLITSSIRHWKCFKTLEYTIISQFDTFPDSLLKQNFLSYCIADALISCFHCLHVPQSKCCCCFRLNSLCCCWIIIPFLHGVSKCTYQNSVTNSCYIHFYWSSFKQHILITYLYIISTWMVSDIQVKIIKGKTCDWFFKAFATSSNLSRTLYQHWFTGHWTWSAELSKETVALFIKTYFCFN